MKCWSVADSKYIDIKKSIKQNPLCILFSTQLNKWSFPFVYKHIYFIHYKWLLNIPYHVSHYYSTNVIINKTCFILSIFRKQRSSYIHQKTLHVVEKIEIDTAIFQ